MAREFPGMTSERGHELTEERLPIYPLDMSAYLHATAQLFEEDNVSSRLSSSDFDPTLVARAALARWNGYLITREEHERLFFLQHAQWLVEHAIEIAPGISGWPLLFARPDAPSLAHCLSALTQGTGLAVLLRAYTLTEETRFLALARRIASTFLRDILDGGVNAPVTDGGLFFEEIAVYPAAHTLNGCLQALLGLSEYLTLVPDTQVAERVQDVRATLCALLDEFDTGFWIRRDLLTGQLASLAEFDLSLRLFDILAQYPNYAPWPQRVTRWRKYRRSFLSEMRYALLSGLNSTARALVERTRVALFPPAQTSQKLSVCVPLPSHPFTGGILTVLEGVSETMRETWEIEYLAQYIGPHAEKYTLHRFSTPRVGPWYFPLVWLYCLAGFLKLCNLRRRGRAYQLLCPQDGVFTAAFTSMAGKLFGVRVVCMDHSTLTWATNSHYHTARKQLLATRAWPWLLRAAVRLLLSAYWPSLALLGRLAARFVDYYLIPGVPGDDIDLACEQLKVPRSRITRFASLIDIAAYPLLEAPAKIALRQLKKLPEDAVVIAIVCRLAQEKGLEIAVESLAHALAKLPPAQRERVLVVIAGNGPMRAQLEQDILIHKLEQRCVLWGEITQPEVRDLLAISDIFLYTSTRGACMAMSVLEAMASGCAVIATTEPISNVTLLANERGIVVPAGDVQQTSAALVRLILDEQLCCAMGHAAREYVALHHSPAIFRRTLLRASYWSELDELARLQSAAQTASISVHTDEHCCPM